MPHGQVDFGAYAVKETVSSLADMGELAARLGSIVTFDRRGDVIWFDDFESGIEKWDKSSSGDRGSIEWSAAKSRNGGFSAKITTGAQSGDFATLTAYLPFPVLSRIGVEFSPLLYNYVGKLKLKIYVYDGEFRHQFEIQHFHITKLFQYKGDDDKWHDMSPTLDLAWFSRQFHTLKLVADAQSKLYTRFIANSQSYDLAAFRSYRWGDGAAPHLWIAIEVTNSNTNAGKAHIDDAIVTQNEP